MNNEQEILQNALSYGTLMESPVDPDGSARELSGPRLPESMSRRMCDKDRHIPWAFWGADGSLVCGFCHPPLENVERQNVEPVRWLRHGGPIGTVPRLGPTAPTMAEPPPERVTAPPRVLKKHRGRAIDGQDPFFG